MLPDRLTIRLSPGLAANLAARGGPHGNLAAIVRQAIEAYLAEERPPRQPGQPPMADMTATAAAVADMSTRLAALELRLAALEARAASGNQRQPHCAPRPTWTRPISACASYRRRGSASQRLPRSWTAKASGRSRGASGTRVR